MNTIMPKKEEIQKKWYLIDASGLVLGRLASQIAMILRGKNKPTYTPNTDLGDYVIVINSDKIVLTGKKLVQKLYTKQTGYTGNIKQTQYKDLMKNDRPKALWLAVKEKKKKNNLGLEMLKK